MSVLSIVLRAVSGLVALLFGRRFFWLFLAIVGFIGGFVFSTYFLPQLESAVHLLVGLGVGVLGALLSRVAPSAIAALIGFFAGGAAIVNLVDTIVDPGQILNAIIFIVGGLASAYLAWKAFDAGVVILSSMAGAAALSSLGAELFPMSGTVHLIVYVLLIVIGILFQFNLIRPHTSDQHEEVLETSDEELV